IRQCWIVRKPTKDGHTTSLEAYDAAGEMIIQFFGKRKEGHAATEEWRANVDSPPRQESAAARQTKRAGTEPFRQPIPSAGPGRRPLRHSPFRPLSCYPRRCRDFTASLRRPSPTKRLR